MSHHPAMTMAGLCAVGGLIGFQRRRSVPSLVAGLTVGALFLAGSLRIKDGRPYGHELATAASAILFASSLGRFRAGPVPQVLTLTSAAAGSYYGYYWYQIAQT